MGRGRYEWKQNEISIKVFSAASVDSSLSISDPTWTEIKGLRERLKGFKPAGFRYVTSGEPQGIEVWFISDGPEKIAFLWIPSRNDSNKVKDLFIKPDDMEWMNKSF